jgi:hypothetical protein
MAVVGLSLVVGALPAGASNRSAPDSTPEAFRGKKPTPTTDSTTPPSTVKVKPTSSTTTARPAPARPQTRQVQLPTTTSTLPAPSPSVVPGTPTPTTTGSAKPHVVAPEQESVPPAFGEVAPTTTSTEVSNPVVGSIGQDKGPKPASPANRRPARSLGRTGAPTGPLLMLGAGTLLLGALAIAFGQPRPVRVTAGCSPGTAPGRRAQLARQGRRVRRTLPGWESGIPLAPERREQARRRIRSRLGRTRVSPPGGAPAA